MALNLTKKKLIAEAMLQHRKNYSGSDIAYASRYKIHASAFSQIRSALAPDGNITILEKLLKEDKWVEVAIALGVELTERKWVTVETDVFKTIREDILFCKEYSKAMIFADECEIGKSYTAKYLSRTMHNTFYLDASQSKSRMEFIRSLARTLGFDDSDTVRNLLGKIKYYLNSIDNPVVIIDEVGDLDYPAFLEIKALWNATDGQCGWYLMGADGLIAKMENGIKTRKIGYREIFSRFSSKVQKMVPIDKSERQAFQKKLLSDVLRANMKNPDEVVDAKKGTTALESVVLRCMANDGMGLMAGLRRADSTLIIHNKRRAA